MKKLVAAALMIAASFPLPAAAESGPPDTLYPQEDLPSLLRRQQVQIGQLNQLLEAARLRAQLEALRPSIIVPYDRHREDTPEGVTILRGGR